MPALGGYLLQYFPVFLLGSIFGKLMSDSGAAAVIGRFVASKLGAERGVLAVIVACAVLTYGGVSLFVVAFSVYPIAVELFRAGQIPKRLIPASIALGSFTFTMSGLPGTPAIQNAIPMPFFGTTAFAAPGLGMIGAIVMFGAGYLWLDGRARRMQCRGEGYGEPLDGAGTAAGTGEARGAPSAAAFAKAVTPLAMVLVINLVLSRWVLPAMDHGYLAEARFGATSPAAVLGLWSLIAAIFGAILLHLLLYRNQLRHPVGSINEGTFGSMLPIFNTASEVGYGATIAALSSFARIRDSLLGLAPEYPLISEAVSINILAGITGSASGGLSIALDALAESYLQLAELAGISPELLHRVATMASGGFDTLPHNGAVTPRTQKVTSRVRGVVGVVVRSAVVRWRRSRGHRNAVADHDRVVIDEDLLDDEAHDSLPLHDVERLGRRAQAREKRRQGLGQAQVGGALGVCSTNAFNSSRNVCSR